MREDGAKRSTLISASTTATLGSSLEQVGDGVDCLCPHGDHERGPHDRDDGGRHVVAGAERGCERGVVAAVGLLGVPAEDGQALVDGNQIEVLAVVDHQQREVSEPQLGGQHDRLPVRALVQLGVAGQDNDAPIGALGPQREGDADRERQAVAERTGRGLDARHQQAVGVPAQAAALPGEGGSQCSGKKPRQASTA